jgi:hypothetical protein
LPITPPTVTPTLPIIPPMLPITPPTVTPPVTVERPTLPVTPPAGIIEPPTLPITPSAGIIEPPAALQSPAEATPTASEVAGGGSGPLAPVAQVAPAFAASSSPPADESPASGQVAAAAPTLSLTLPDVATSISPALIQPVVGPTFSSPIATAAAAAAGFVPGFVGDPVSAAQQTATAAAAGEVSAVADGVGAVAEAVVESDAVLPESDAYGLATGASLLGAAPVGQGFEQLLGQLADGDEALSERGSWHWVCLGLALAGASWEVHRRLRQKRAERASAADRSEDEVIDWSNYGFVE